MDSINLPTILVVGCLELERLRAASQARLGDAFHLRRFHDRVLSYGHMPPTLVARAITAADEQGRGGGVGRTLGDGGNG
jgi:hypothetical protein